MDSAIEKTIVDINKVSSVIREVRAVLLKGSGEVAGQHVNIETGNLEPLLRIVSSYYSWTMQIWGNVKSVIVEKNVVRKHEESLSYIRIKNGGVKVTQKDAEMQANIEAFDYIKDCAQWEAVFSRISGYKEALESFSKTLEGIHWMRKQEMETLQRT